MMRASKLAIPIQSNKCACATSSYITCGIHIWTKKKTFRNKTHMMKYTIKNNDIGANFEAELKRYNLKYNYLGKKPAFDVGAPN